MKEAGASSNSSSSGSGSEWERAQQAVRVSVDLVAAAQQHFRLLRAVDCCAGLYSGPAVRRAIRRRVTVLGICREGGGMEGGWRGGGGGLEGGWRGGGGGICGEEGTSGAGFHSWTRCKGDGREQQQQQQQQQQQAGEEERQSCHRASCRLWTCTGYGCATDSRLYATAAGPLPFPYDAYARDCMAMFSRVLDCPLPLLDPAAASSSSSSSTSFSSSSSSFSSAQSPHSPSLLSPPTPSMHTHSFNQYADQQQQQAEAVAVSRRVWNERWPGDPYDLHLFQPGANAAAGAAASLAALHLPPSLLGPSSSFRSTPSSLSVESPRAPSAAPAAAATAGALGSRAEQEGGECAVGEEEAAASSVQERISYDLEAAVARQAQFYHQIARPHMHDAKYLVGAVERYKAFLWLLKHHLPAADSSAAAAGGAGSGGGDGSGGAGSMFIPALDIDFVWHAHQLAPLAYAHDCNVLLGRLLAHHDSLPDHHHHAPPTSSSHPPLSSSSAHQQQQRPSLASATQSTAATWLGFYNRPYARAGTIRKEPAPPPFPFPPPLKPKHGVGAGAGGGGGSGAGSTASGASSTGTGSHLPSGNSSRGTSKIASPVSSPGASPIQDTRGELRAGIPPRHVFDATLSLLSVSSLPASLKGDLSLQISALSACPSLRLRSHKLPLPLPSQSTPSQSLLANEQPWPSAPTWWLSLDVETKGVVLQLLLEPPKGRLSGIAGMAGMGGAHKARSLGEVTVLWSDVFAAKDLSWHGALALGSGAGAGGKVRRRSGWKGKAQERVERMKPAFHQLSSPPSSSSHRYTHVVLHVRSRIRLRLVLVHSLGSDANQPASVLTHGVSLWTGVMFPMFSSLPFGSTQNSDANQPAGVLTVCPSGLGSSHPLCPPPLKSPPTPLHPLPSSHSPPPTPLLPLPSSHSLYALTPVSCSNLPLLLLSRSLLSQPAPVLLMLQPAVGTDDSGLQLTTVAAAVLKQQQEGRWMARTVVDHTLSDRFVLRTR
ncbi:unnamed protein product [Closterium sp. Naga37s-1]|nr:unnamed protein product [Closterium sp. Naga37s-1]